MGQRRFIFPDLFTPTNTYTKLKTITGKNTSLIWDSWRSFCKGILNWPWVNIWSGDRQADASRGQSHQTGSCITWPITSDGQLHHMANHMLCTLQSHSMADHRLSQACGCKAPHGFRLCQSQNECSQHLNTAVKMRDSSNDSCHCIANSNSGIIGGRRHKHNFCRNNGFVMTKTILVTAPANDIQVHLNMTVMSTDKGIITRIN